MSDGAGVRSHTFQTRLRSLEFILKARRIQMALDNFHLFLKTLQLDEMSLIEKNSVILMRHVLTCSIPNQDI